MFTHFLCLANVRNTELAAERKDRAALRAFAGVPDQEYVIDIDPPWKQKKKRKALRKGIKIAAHNARTARVCPKASSQCADIFPNKTLLRLNIPTDVKNLSMI